MTNGNQDFKLISVREQNGQQLVDARELHSFLGIGRDFSNWIKYYIKKYGFVENVDYSPILARIDGRGKNAIEYALTLDMAKELSMVSRTKKGKEARSYFINIEKKYIKEIIEPRTIDSETSKLFNNILESIKQYSPTAAQTVGVKMLKAYGIEMPYTALPLVVEERWSATEIAKELGISAIKVGKIANILDLKRQPFSEKRLSTAKNNNKEITMYYYTQKAKDKIKDFLTDTLAISNDTLTIYDQ